MVLYESLLDTIGGTPLIRLSQVTRGLRPRVYAKIEASNPGGSVKDRAALWMVRAAERSGDLREGGTIVETTSGNTGIGLALVAAHLGYRCVIFTGSIIAREKRAQLRAYGAEIVLVDSFVPKSDPSSLLSAAQRFVAATPGAWLAGQYDNEANPQAHFDSTGPEIWEDTAGTITHLVASIGTGGTISGTARYLKQASGNSVSVIGAEPSASAYRGGDGSPNYIEGAGHFVHPDATEDAWPESLDLSVIDRFVGVPDEQAIAAVRQLARIEGMLVGGSAGVVLNAALELATELTEKDVIVAIFPDSGRSYLSTYFDDEWLRETGFGSADVACRTVLDRATPVSHSNLVDRSESIAAILHRPHSDDTDVYLAVYSRERSAAVHPSEIVGWVTRAELRDVVGRDPYAGSSLVGDYLHAGIARIGGRRDLEEVISSVCSDGSDWEQAVVLIDGRVAGTVSRSTLASHVAVG